MGWRTPWPWEGKGDAVEFTPTDLPPASEPQEPFPGARRMADMAAGESDPHRARRGAAGAAEAMFQESQARGWGLDRDACRARTNQARKRAASRK